MALVGSIPRINPPPFLKQAGNPQIAAMGLQDDTAFKVRTVDPERVKMTRALAEAAEKREV